MSSQVLMGLNRLNMKRNYIEHVWTRKDDQRIRFEDPSRGIPLFDYEQILYDSLLKC